MISLCIAFIVYKIIGVDITIKGMGSNTAHIILIMGILSDVNIAATILAEVLL